MQLFCDAKREEIKAANPGASFGETGKLLAAAWKDCPAEDKARFQEQSQVCIAPLYQHQARNCTLPLSVLSMLYHVCTARGQSVLCISVNAGV